jgi:fluoride exporter
MLSYLWIALGGALGTTARYWLSGVVARSIGETFPWGTLVINVTGSFVIGFFGAQTGPDGRVFVGSNCPPIRHDRYVRWLYDILVV